MILQPRREAGPVFERACSALRAAAAFDPTVDPKGTAKDRLLATWIPPTGYRSSDLFQAMSRAEPRLFHDFPIDPRTREPRGIETHLLPAIRSGFPARKRARVRGRGAVRYQPIPAVLDRWRAGRTRFGVTDLHYIGTAFDRKVDTRALNAFNLLPRGALSYQSQDSLVISTCGAVTDSHSDDHSGSNHCFVGQKVWLLWDTLEGLERGLEDASHSIVSERAAFSFRTFMRLGSARWLAIGPGQTMFIPAHLSHKVVTLAPYLGLGSFHAALPGLPDLLQRWQALRPQWSADAEHARARTRILVQRAVRKLLQLKAASAADRAAWGVDQLVDRLRRQPRGSAGEAGAATVESPYLEPIRRALLELAR